MAEAWIRIRLRLRTVMRAAKLFRDAANRVHEDRHRAKSEGEKRMLSELANEHDASALEIDAELKRIDEGRDI